MSDDFDNGLNQLKDTSSWTSVPDQVPRRRAKVVRFRSSENSPVPGNQAPLQNLVPAQDGGNVLL